MYVSLFTCICNQFLTMIEGCAAKLILLCALKKLEEFFWCDILSFRHLIQEDLQDKFHKKVLFCF